jgi:hypothetical protein
MLIFYSEFKNYTNPVFSKKRINKVLIINVFLITEATIPKYFVELQPQLEKLFLKDAGKL